MPANLVFHEGNALAFYRFLNNCSWSSLYCSGLIKCRGSLVKVISVNPDYVKMKSFKFLVNGIRRADFINRAVNLEIVVFYLQFPLIRFDS